MIQGNESYIKPACAHHRTHLELPNLRHSCCSDYPPRQPHAADLQDEKELSFSCASQADGSASPVNTMLTRA